MKQKIFVIHPVRNITPDFHEAVQAYIDQVRGRGDEVYDPAESTNQNGSSFQICQENLQAIEDADYVAFTWDGKSQGCLFDLGMAFALHKPVMAVIGLTPRMSNGKSFQNLAYELDEMQAY